MNFWQRNKGSILFSIILASVLALIFIGAVRIAQNNRVMEAQNRVTEEIKKTAEKNYRLSLCIALIEPEQRTPSVIKKCLEDGTIPPKKSDKQQKNRNIFQEETFVQPAPDVLPTNRPASNTTNNSTTTNNESETRGAIDEITDLLENLIPIGGR